ncbi:MAG: phage tail sheath subtilisin-like domain-containing protein [Chloroflexota bacterium]
MATTYLSPGVYVEEVDKGTKPIQVLGTSTPAFLGITAQASEKFPATGAPDPEKLVLNKPQLITNWTQYKTVFGGFVKGAYLPDAIYGYFNNGGGPCYITSLLAVDEDEKGEKASLSLSEATVAEIQKAEADGEENPKPSTRGRSNAKNGFTVTAKLGGRYGTDIQIFIAHEKGTDGKPNGQFTMRVEYPSVSGTMVERLAGLIIKDEKLLNTAVRNDKNEPQPAQFDAVDITVSGSSIPPENPRNQKGNPIPYQLTLATMPDTTIRPLDQNLIIGDEAEQTGIESFTALDNVRLIICPDLMAGLPKDGSILEDENAKKRVFAVQKAMQAHCERLRYRFAILDTPPGLNAKQVKEWRSELGIDSSYCALYYPWLEVADFSGSNGKTTLVPPSGYMAGVYNRVDGNRGVHKAPANEAPLGVIGLERRLTKGEQDTLNPVGINCFRFFAGGRGIKIWGARTLSSDGSWRYINVRRLFITIAASLDEGLQWVVFEPNDSVLWSKVRRDVGAFLGTFWLNGALFGNTQSQAFYVKCDEELNPQPIRDLGQLIIEVGLCPVKPAEFVILRLSQWAGPNAEG